MNELEFKRIIAKTPGVKTYYIQRSGNRLTVWMTFRWYAWPISYPMLSFLATIFTYMHVPGTIIIFNKGRPKVVFPR